MFYRVIGSPLDGNPLSSSNLLSGDLELDNECSLNDYATSDDVRLTGGDGSLKSGGLIGQRPFIWCRVDLEEAEIKIN
jgi:hypothetical protein